MGSDVALDLFSLKSVGRVNKEAPILEPKSPYKMGLVEEGPQLNQLAQIVFGIGLIMREGYCEAKELILEDTCLLSEKTSAVLSEMGYAPMEGGDPNFLYKWYPEREKPVTIIRLPEGSSSLWGVSLIGPGPEADNDLQSAVCEAERRIERSLGIINIQLKAATIPEIAESGLGQIIACISTSFQESKTVCALDSTSIHEFLRNFGLDPDSQVLVAHNTGIA